ncbi:type II secretion system F family protein [Candidatus Poriferisodalis sp.]|uniref:type II secretion system F family protein n=1 Tax=Candidatus Poriferisodalis sp. TaxID=3101277 RepID=UPI003B019E95
MTVQAIVLAAGAVAGVLCIGVGLRRRARARDGADARGLHAAVLRARALVERDLGRQLRLRQDAAVLGRRLESHALAKLGGLIVGAVFMVIVVAVMSVAFGVSIPLLLAAGVAGCGALAGWWLPDSILKTDAAKERERFKQSAEAWLELVAQLTTAGADVHAALHTAAGYSRQPAFQALRDALVEASASGEPAWAGLRRLSDSQRLGFLEPFIASLQLTGATGAGARDAILSQVEAVRSKTLAEADAAAASASEKMGAPLAFIGGAFMMLMGYPPLAGILDSGAVAGGGL